jgi:hypothetical protein
MTRAGALLIIMMFLFMNAAATSAYEVRTHGEITRRALELSTATAVYLRALGVDTKKKFAFETRTRPEELAEFDNDGTALGWMTEGAIREDDYVFHSMFAAMGCRTPRNPVSELDRPRHHFFDVQRSGQGLTVLGQSLGLPAPDWALGTAGRGPGPDQNQFSLADARDYQLWSLTAETRAERERNTARLFRALGQVAHVLEDMAQPQHTRNDPHLGCLDIVAGEESWYETYIETRALGQQFRTRGQPSPPLVLDGYPPVSRRPYRELFAGDGRGLAEFSSRNFFSTGTNLSRFGNCGGLSAPVCEPGAYRKEVRPFTVTTVDGTAVSGTVTLYMASVRDDLAGLVIPDVPVSSRSVWDQHLEARGLLPEFTLNSINYDAAADLLIPRAVGYVTGLLDAFFRARLDGHIQIASGSEGLQARLEFTNTTPDEEMEGTFALYYDTPDATRRAVPDAAWTARLGPGERFGPVTVRVPGEASPSGFLLVFTGRLGPEGPPDGAPVVTAARLARAFTGSVYRYLEEWSWPYANLSSRYEDAPTFTDIAALLGGASILNGGESFWRIRIDYSPAYREGTTLYSTFGWRSQAGYVIVYREDDGPAWLTLSADPLSGCYGMEEVQYYYTYAQRYSWITTFPFLPAEGRVVAFEPPADLATLFGYSYYNQPRVAAILGDFGTGAGPLRVRLDGIRMFGLQLTSDLDDPGPLPEDPMGWAHAEHQLSRMCYVKAQIEIEPAAAQ